MKIKINQKYLLYIFVAALMVGTVSCLPPANKDDYLEKFTAYVDNVGEDHSNYNKSDWDYADERFHKFSHEWHERFEDELTLKEELKVAALIVRYNSYKGVNKLEKIYKDEFKDDVDRLKDKVQYYIENDMDEDLEKLKQGAKEIGDSTLRVLEEIIDEIQD